MVPTIGRIVHYVSYGTPGGEYHRACRAAIVTEVPKHLEEEPYDGRRNDGESGPIIVRLAVLNPDGLFFTKAKHDNCGGRRGDRNCPDADHHGRRHRYCECGWMEPELVGGTWHWPTIHNDREERHDQDQ